MIEKLKTINYRNLKCRKHGCQNEQDLKIPVIIIIIIIIKFNKYKNG